jgi:arylformamidase
VAVADWEYVRQDDGGLLLSHRAFWGLPARGSDGDVPVLPSRTITEMCYCSDLAADGVYLLSLQIAPVALEAAPCRPILYPLHPLGDSA